MTRFTTTAAWMDGSINVFFYRAILVFGCLLALWQLIACRDSFRPKTQKEKTVPYDFILWGAFILVICISTALNYSYNLADNMYGILTFGFQLVLFYLLGKTLTAAEWISLIKKIILPCSFLWDVSCAGSLVQFLFNMSYRTIFSKEHSSVRQGIIDGRLFGLFSDPNFAAFTSLLLMFGLWHIRSHVRHTSTKFFIWLSLVLNAMYIVMSNSRTVYISVAASILFYSLVSCYKKYRQDLIKHLIQRTLATCILLVASYLAILLPLQGIAKLICPNRNTAVEMERDDVNADNISNNRFTIWQAYLELYTEKPLFGFSTRSALTYVDENHPDSYLAKTQYVTHNTYLSLLVETGAIGFLVFAIFMVLTFLRFVRNIREQSDTYLLFSTWIVTILIFGLCFHDIFFTLNLETMLFLCGLGFLWNTADNKLSAAENHI
jgi:lipopolysaccharide cholinephosphotransferase